MTWLLIGFGWLKDLAAYIVGLVARYPWQVALIAALALAWWQHGGKVDALEKLDAEIQAHAITRDSVALLQSKIADQNAAIEALAAKGREAAKRQQKALRDAQIANTRADRAIERIRGRVVDPAKCETGDAVMGAGL